MATKRPGKKAPAKAGAIDESVPDVEQRKWEFLAQLGQRGGPEYLLALRNAIESEATIPTESLRPLAMALRAFDSKEPRSVQLTTFARALALSGKKGRPRKDEAKFWRAVSYWELRLMEDDGVLSPMTDSEAIAWLEENGTCLPSEDRHEVLDESQIRRAVHDFPSARTFVEGMKAAFDGALGQGGE